MTFTNHDNGAYSPYIKNADGTIAAMVAPPSQDEVARAQRESLRDNPPLPAVYTWETLAKTYGMTSANAHVYYQCGFPKPDTQMFVTNRVTGRKDPIPAWDGQRVRYWYANMNTAHAHMKWTK